MPNTITIPVDIFEELLKRNYFVEACNHYNIEKWEHYKEMMEYATILSETDIAKEMWYQENGAK